LATINHSGVPKIYQYFSEGGSDYIVMEFVEGDNLEQALTHVDDQGRQHPGQPLPAETVAGYGISLCKVLEYLAARTDPRTGQLTPIIHHDIKPANIILDANSGEVRLVDFGTAKLRVSTSAFSGSMKQSSVYGTEGYAPLEQYRGQSQPRSDVYALAATLYHLLTDDDPRDHAFDFPPIGCTFRSNCARRWSLLWTRMSCGGPMRLVFGTCWRCGWISARLPRQQVPLFSALAIVCAVSMNWPTYATRVGTRLVSTSTRDTSPAGWAAHCTAMI
jgi:serine/threonine protein kinase